MNRKHLFAFHPVQICCLEVWVRGTNVFWNCVVCSYICLAETERALDKKEGKIKSSNCTYLSFVVVYYDYFLLFLFWKVKIYWLNGYVLKGYTAILCMQLLKLVYYMWSMWAHVHQLPKRLKLKAAKLHVFISKFYQIHKRCFKSCVQLR